MRLTRTEETGDPDTVGVSLVEIAFAELGKPLVHLAGDNVFLQLGAKVTCVVGLDDALDGAVDGLEEQLMNL
jgi:hypothetical protein